MRLSMIFFTADEHYGHANIMKYCNRPFGSVQEMNRELVRRHNLVVGSNDLVIHAGDFCWGKNKIEAEVYITQLNGNHVFLKGSHDRWLSDSAKYMWRKRIDGILVVACHYAMRVWEGSHYNSWQVYGHSHGKLRPVGKQWDIGVDNNDFYPVPFDKLKEIMATRPDNFNLVFGKQTDASINRVNKDE